MRQLILLVTCVAMLLDPSRAQTFVKRAGEKDTAFVLRHSPVRSSLIHGPVAARWNSVPMLVAVFQSAAIRQKGGPAPMESGAAGSPQSRTRIEGHIYAELAAGRYRRYALAPFPLVGTNPKVLAVFFADADKDPRKELVVAVKWDSLDPRKGRQTWFAAIVYDDLSSTVGDTLVMLSDSTPDTEGFQGIRVHIETDAELSKITAGEALAALRPSRDPIFFIRGDEGTEPVDGKGIRIDTCGTDCLAVVVGGFSGGGFMEGAWIKTDTCGFLAGRRLFCTDKSITQLGVYQYESELTIEAEAPSASGGDPAPPRVRLLTWSRQSERSVWEVQEFPTPSMKADKHGLKLSTDETGNKLSAHFIWQGEGLHAAPSFRKRLFNAVAKADSGLGDLEDLRSRIDPHDWNADKAILQVLDLLAIRDSIASGHLDFAIDALAEIGRDPADPSISKHGRRLLDSVKTWKEAHRPVLLEGARKIGRLLEEPYYPPLDSPSVFWQDSLLCVVQKEGDKTKGMWTWDPRLGTWSGLKKIKYPETGITSLYVLGCDGKMRFAYPGQECWSRKMPEPTEDNCPYLDCAPLLILDDTIPGSVEKAEDLGRAGGSCAAGWGKFRFAGNGLLYRANDGRLGWRLLPGAAEPVFGRKSYDLGPETDYPVVVSPDQQWVAFALRSKDGTAIELWTGRLRYRE